MKTAVLNPATRMIAVHALGIVCLNTLGSDGLHSALGIIEDRHAGRYVFLGTIMHPWQSWPEFRNIPGGGNNAYIRTY